MSAPWARDGKPDLACALALVGRKALGANRDGRAHITTSRVIVTWNHIEIGIGGEASVTAAQEELPSRRNSKRTCGSGSAPSLPAWMTVLFRYARAGASPTKCPTAAAI